MQSRFLSLSNKAAQTALSPPSPNLEQEQSHQAARVRSVSQQGASLARCNHVIPLEQSLEPAFILATKICRLLALTVLAATVTTTARLRPSPLSTPKVMNPMTPPVTSKKTTTSSTNFACATVRLLSSPLASRPLSAAAHPRLRPTASRPRRSHLAHFPISGIALNVAVEDPWRGPAFDNVLSF